MWSRWRCEGRSAAVDAKAEGALGPNIGHVLIEPIMLHRWRLQSPGMQLDGAVEWPVSYKVYHRRTTLNRRIPPPLNHKEHERRTSMSLRHDLTSFETLISPSNNHTVRFCAFLQGHLLVSPSSEALLRLIDQSSHSKYFLLQWE